MPRRAASFRTAALAGFMLLAGPPAAYGSRLALAQGAQKTLDLQYYAIHADASTAQLLKAVIEAAAPFGRGNACEIEVRPLYEQEDFEPGGSLSPV